MAETRADAYATAAALLCRMGYSAFVREGWVPPGGRKPVTAIVTCAPPIVLGMSLGLTAEDPERHLPERTVKAARPAPNKAGDQLWAHWVDDPSP